MYPPKFRRVTENASFSAADDHDPIERGIGLAMASPAQPMPVGHPARRGSGHAPQRFANAASDRTLVGLSPATIIISAAESGTIPNASRSVGAAVIVIVSSASSCVSISADSVIQRVASARNECFTDAVGSLCQPPPQLDSACFSDTRCSSEMAFAPEVQLGRGVRSSWAVRSSIG